MAENRVPLLRVVGSHPSECTVTVDKRQGLFKKVGQLISAFSHEVKKT